MEGEGIGGEVATRRRVLTASGLGAALASAIEPWMVPGSRGGGTHAAWAGGGGVLGGRMSFESSAYAAGTALPDYTVRGPYTVKTLPRLEHIATSIFPQCVGDTCLLKIDACVPSRPMPPPDTMFPPPSDEGSVAGAPGTARSTSVVLNGKDGAAAAAVSSEGDAVGQLPALTRGPYPLAIITSGFLVESEQYASYARQGASTTPA